MPHPPIAWLFRLFVALRWTTTTALLFSALLTATSLVASSGCGDSGPGPTQPPANGAIGAACSENVACNLESCLSDPAFPGGYCIADCAANPKVCPGGSACTRYGGKSWCMDGCGKDAECRKSYVCDYGICRPPCTRQDQCNSGDRCQEGRCRAPCKSDGECAPSRCQDGDCVPPCKKDTDCLPGQSCDTATGGCKARPGKQMGEACSKPGPGSECATAWCMPTRKICSVTCTGTKDCPPGSWVCGLEKLDNDFNGTFDGAVAACVPRKGPGGATAPCTKDDECASSHCYSGWCLEGCKDDGGCSSGQTCADVNLLLQAAIAKYKGCLPKSGISETTLGTFKDSQLHGFDIPSNTQSFVLVTRVDAPDEVPVVAQLSDPNNKVLFQNADQCGYYSQPNRYLYEAQISAALVPNTSTIKVVPGIYSYALTSTKPGIPITVKLLLRTGKKTSGTIDVNWIFANLASTCIPGSTLNAASAPTHGWFKTLRTKLLSILNKAKLGLGKQTYHDLKKPALDIITMSNTSSELPQLFASTKGLTGRALNIFFVRDIQISGSGAGGIILGISGGIPGPPGIHGTVHSGLAMSMQTACFEQYGYNPAHTLGHEIGHYLGLFHNMEAPSNPGFDEDSGAVVCPCPCGANMRCQYGGTQKWCRGTDHLPDTSTSEKNLLFYAAESTQNFEGNQLTTTQQRVMLDNPVVR